MTFAKKPEARSKDRGSKKTPKSKTLSRLHKPEEMGLEEWQTGLRRQFGREQKFKLENVGGAPVFSEYRVSNPQSGSTYRVAIRGSREGDNYCACPDFATNTLGTCKHIEFVLVKLERKPGGKAALRAGFQPPYSEIVLKYGARREVRFRPGTDCPAELIAQVKKYFDGVGSLRPDAFSTIESFLATAKRFRHDVRCYDDVLGFIAEVRDGERRRSLIDAEFPDGIRSVALNKLLKVDLYDYQREGALFAARAGRCLIGDEMGLGKTIQAIAAAEIMARHLGVSRVLVICPTSLKHQWEREISNFSSRSARVIQGLRARRQELFSEDAFFKITNYDTVHRDLDLIANWSPDLVILDEAQRIKNWNTRAARSVKKIIAPHAIVLTGTPLENRLEELVSIVEFVDRYRLGPTFRFLANHQMQDDFGKVIGYRDLDSVGKTLQPMLLRRRKDQVLKQLPERLDKTFFVRMTPEQMVHHEENREIVVRIVSKWRRFRFLSEADQRRLMIALQNMRMSCNSTFLLDQTTDHGTKADELAVLLDEIYELPDIKVVVFSQWQRTHEILQRRLKARGYEHVLFTGSVPGSKRKELVDRFREDKKCRVFLSTDAGGVGLNLQHASIVINMDLPWNPAILEQRIGRVHRLGQKRPVQVVNFVAQGTIEEGMLSLLKFKKSLFTGALDGGANEVFLGGSRLTRFMETVDKAAGSIPAPPPEEPPSTEPESGKVPVEGVSEGTGLPTTIPEKSSSATSTSSENNGFRNRTDGDGKGNPWAGLLETGLAFLKELSQAAHPRHVPGEDSSDNSAGSSSSGRGLVRRDPETGEPFLRLPVPSPEVLDQILSAASALLERMRR
jgi:superfamily II DNA or RNA helicase